VLCGRTPPDLEGPPGVGLVHEDIETMVAPVRGPLVDGVVVTKRTFQPNNRRRAKTHGFRLRMRTRAGRAIVSARRRKGRRELSA